MRLLESAWDSGGDVAGHHELDAAHADSGTAVALQALHRHGSHSTSFIRRCWYPERGCDESSTCADLRKLWEGGREDVKVLPDATICGRPQYIVTGTSRTSRNGVSDDSRLETLVFPGERWHKCCIIPDPNNDKKPPRFVCEHLKTVDRQKLHREMKGWCGTHKCINPRDRCLVVDEVKEKDVKAKYKGDCPLGCKRKCDKLHQKFECIFIGNEPIYGQEGSETPTKNLWNEKEPYDVYALTTDYPEELPVPEVKTDGTEVEADIDKVASSCAPFLAALLPAPVLSQESTMRHQRWSRFLG